MTPVIPPSPTNSDATQAFRAALRVGGEVRLPNAPLTLLSPQVVPPGVRIVGEGPGSQLVFPRDFGPGEIALSADPRANQGSNCSFENFSIVGPGVRGVIGVAPAQMDGLCIGSFGVARDVTIEQRGFRAGIVVKGDHEHFERVRSPNSLYGWLWAENPRSKSNQTLIDCFGDMSLLASFCVEGNNILDSVEIVGGHAGFSPYVFLKIDGPTSGPSQLGLMQNTTVDGMAWEAVGNGAVMDRSTGGGAGSATMDGCEIHRPGFRWCSGDGEPYRMASAPRDFALVVRNVFDTRIFGGACGFTAGDVAVLDALERAQIEWECGANELPADLSAWQFVAGPNAAKSCDVRLRIIRSGMDCTARPIITSGASRVGQAAVKTQAWYTVSPANGQNIPGGPPMAFAGIYLTQTADGQVAIVAESGVVQALCETMAFAGFPLRLSAGGPWLSPLPGAAVAIAQGPQQSPGVALTTARIA